MLKERRQVISLFVDRSSERWIVRDPQGRYWVLPPGDEAWESRQPYEPIDEADLEPVPGHYKFMLGLPS